MRPKNEFLLESSVDPNTQTETNNFIGDCIIPEIKYEEEDNEGNEHGVSVLLVPAKPAYGIPMYRGVAAHAKLTHREPELK